MRSQRGSLFHIKHLNPALTWAGIASLIATVLVIYVPFLREAFGFSHISLQEFGIAIVLAVLIIPIVEIIKFIERKTAAK